MYSQYFKIIILFSVLLNEADSTTHSSTDLDVTISYSNSKSSNQSLSDTNSGSNFVPFVFFHDESNSRRSSLNSGPLFREDNFTTSKSDSDTEQEQANQNPENNTITG